MESHTPKWSTPLSPPTRSLLFRFRMFLVGCCV